LSSANSYIVSNPSISLSPFCSFPNSLSTTFPNLMSLLSLFYFFIYFSSCSSSIFYLICSSSTNHSAYYYSLTNSFTFLSIIPFTPAIASSNSVLIAIFASYFSYSLISLTTSSCISFWITVFKSYLITAVSSSIFLLWLLLFSSVPYPSLFSCICTPFISISIISFVLV